MYYSLQGAAYAEAKLLPASDVTLQSSGFVVHKCVTED
jgi:hypothetical protein